MPREAQKTLQSTAHKQNVHGNFAAVLRSRKYLFRLWLRGAINPNYGFGSGSGSSPKRFFRHLDFLLLSQTVLLSYLANFLFDFSIFLRGFMQP